MSTTFIAIHRTSGKTVQLADPEAAATFLQRNGKADYELHLCRKLDLTFSDLERIEQELKSRLLFTGDSRYDLLTQFCAYLDALEIAFCRENDEGLTDQQWVERAQAKDALAEEFLGAIDNHGGQVIDYYSRKEENPANANKRERIQNFVQCIINDLEAGRHKDALLRAVDLLNDLRDGFYQVKP